MKVHIDNYEIEFASERDVALFCACLLPTPEQVELAKLAAQAERDQVMRDTGLVIDADGHITGEAAA